MSPMKWTQTVSWNIYIVIYLEFTINAFSNNEQLFSSPKGIFFFFFVAMRMRDISSPTRDQMCAPCSGSVES